MRTVLFVTQIIFSLLLLLSVLSQQRGGGLSATFGGGGSFHASKRGAEKVLHIATIVFATLFVLNSVAFLFFQ
ncbi:preprotein translocase subunit SecG [Candidatus Peregrinibacteria bacterium]|jgi:protein translocase SecG subunit|nr:preprotein translocase subunit SecG [Candidatus Peregrinibacteria bacterium]MBT4148346.1 preprotein translocase subunit SecG [Candidatus Peregrinibacteria bacterium]MBT4366687.1 preprotein translocase subunit SecG [Candidatus Peregrinibacteria bacterium]MBT4455901.1 preprotein translocase subunit SecG [Candidatus Peregrinibacteria bacterium]